MSKHTAIPVLVREPRQGRPYEATDRERVLEYAARRRAEGAGLVRVAREVGIAPGTLKKWIATRAFARVEIVGSGRQAVGHTVRGPRGIVVEGLTLVEIAELIRSLA